MFIFILSSVCISAQADQKDPVYTKVDLNLPQGHLILAYSDMDTDHSIDIITLHNTTLHILLYKPKLKNFVDGLSVNQIGQQDKILIADFNYDGWNDFLICSGSKIRFKYLDGCKQYKCNQIKQVQKNIQLTQNIRQISLIDPLGNMIPDLFITFDTGKSMHYRLYGDKYQQQTSLFDNTNLIKPSMIDFNGDCLADLIFFNSDNPKLISLFSKEKKDQYKNVKNISLDKDIIDFTWGDMNHDGFVDLVAIVGQQSQGYFIRVMVSDKSQNKICKKDQNLYFSEQSNNTFDIQIGKSYKKGSIYLADLNIDGYPDILTIQNNTAKARLNVICQNCSIYSSQQQMLNRYFKLINLPVQQYDGNVISFSSFDYKQDGILNLMINYKDKNSTTQLSVLKLSTRYDAFIMKVLPLYSSKQQSNSLAFGITLHWLVTDINGNYINSVGNQLPCAISGSLALPYFLIGLGRTNNYVEDLIVGYNKQYDNTRIWTPIIPNSQLIITPNQQDWNIDIYIKPTDKIYLVLMITVGILLILGLLILYFHKKEKQEDQKGRQAFFHLIK